MQKFFERIWYSKLNIYSLALLPFSLIFYIVVNIRFFLYKYKILPRYKSKIPLIIIGNISVGGSGKTPFVIWLANYLLQKDLSVGVISSGYKGASTVPVFVTPKSSPKLVGDEAVLIAKYTNCSVISGGCRVEATKFLTDMKSTDVILHDDGLQHYKLERDFEIILINSDKLFGNNLLLPSGPLREPKSRLNDADIYAYMNSDNDQNYSINSNNTRITNPITAESRNMKEYSNKKVHLVTGIASVDSIIKTLKKHNIGYILHEYNDHHSFDGSEVIFDDDHPIFITQKDYVKLTEINDKNIWIIEHTIKPNKLFIDKINSELSSLLDYEK